MKKWLMLLLFMGGTTLSFAQYGSSSSGQQYNPYQSGNSSQSYGQQQQQTQTGPPSDNLKSSDPEAYAFSQKLSPIHQHAFYMFNRVQQKQAMALAGSPTQGIKGEAGSITPDMAVEVVMQTARETQGSQNNTQQQPTPYQSQPSYPSQGQNSSRSGRYSNY